MKILATVIIVLAAIVMCHGAMLATEQKCSDLCICRREENSSKVQVATCIVSPQDRVVHCSVEWPVLTLTVAMYQFDSNLLIRCQRIKRLMITPESALTVLRADMFRYNSYLETLVVKAPIVTLESVFLRHTSSLRQLDISETKVTGISRSIFEECPITDRLRLVQNQISFIEDNSFKNCIYLRKLDLSRNALRKLNPSTFEGLFNLEDLDLSRNKIDTLDDLNFLCLKKLKTLILSHNTLKSLNKNTFGNMETVTHLRLDSNKITYMAAESFHGLKSIEVINLRENKMATLDAIQFYNLRQLKITFPDVECVQVRDEDSASLSMDVLQEFKKHTLCHGFKRRENVIENKKLIQQNAVIERESATSTSKPKDRDTFLLLIENHPYMIPMVLGGLVVALISILVVAVVCHVKNKRINQLKLQELQLPMMQSTL